VRPQSFDQVRTHNIMHRSRLADAAESIDESATKGRIVGWPGDKTMFIEQLLPKARERLVTIADDVLLIAAAKLLLAEAELLILCDSAGVMTGVLTKTDVVAQISHCHGTSCMTAASQVMTRDVLLCHPADRLHDVWSRMKARCLKNIPVVDQNSHPLGLLHARDILQILLKESEDEEAMLRDYVMGVGYR
jgi:CBS domain-containing protein